MAKSESAKEKLFKKVVELIYGKPQSLTREQRAEVTESFRQRLTRWKNGEALNLIGPLQPASMFSYMLNLSKATISKVAKEVGVVLPSESSFEEFNMDDIGEEKAEEILLVLEVSPDPDEELLQILANQEKSGPFEVVDLTTNGKLGSPEEYEGTLKSIAHLQELIKKHRKGEVHSMTVITLMNNGKLSIWLPASIAEEDVNPLYDPIIQLMTGAPPDSGGDWN